MTVSYTSQIATVRFSTLWSLLIRWKGSIYKVLWKDFLIFVTLYFSLSITYRVILTDDQKRQFEKLAQYCDQHTADIPLAFVLGFYVTMVVNRWWAQVNEYVPGTANLAILVSTYLHGSDERGRLMRRTIMRYVTLGWILAMRSISTMAKKRFPTLDHVVELGVMTPNERDIFENVKTASNKYFLPFVWAASLLKRARKEDRITSDHAFVTLVQEVCKFRGSLGTLFNYDWISIPLMYTQVVTIAVRVYFISCLFGRQFLDPTQKYQSYQLDIYIPIFTFLQFLFYVGWLKVAESLINPFGEDDDDYETNCVLDRILQVGYLIVDELHSELPTLVRDQYWDEVEFVLPYTAAAEQFKSAPFQGSANQVEVAHSAQQLVMPVIKEEEYEAPENRDSMEKERGGKSLSGHVAVKDPVTTKSKGLISVISRQTRGHGDVTKPAVRLVSISQLRQEREKADAISGKVAISEPRWSDPILAPANKDSICSITKENLQMQGHTLTALVKAGEGAAMAGVFSEALVEPLASSMSPVQILVSSADKPSGCTPVSTAQTSQVTTVDLPIHLDGNVSRTTAAGEPVSLNGRLSQATAVDVPIHRVERPLSYASLSHSNGRASRDSSHGPPQKSPQV